MLWANLVTHNEAGRYLRECLQWLDRFVDGMAVYDDRSDDDTAEIARECNAIVAVRPPGDPSFLDHEGYFREAAWRHLEETFMPEPHDWVLAVDADEFPVAETDIREAIEINICRAEVERVHGIEVPIPEVFGWDGDTPLVRTDGWWSGVSGIRLARYQRYGTFPHRRMACGSVPCYARNAVAAEGLHFLHLGYARQQDRIEKFARYSHLPGHNPKHIASILQPPTTCRWEGAVPVRTWR